MSTSTHSDDFEEPTVCPDCGAGLSRAEDDEEIRLDCPSCGTTLVYPKNGA